jgi:hypothetical protein
MVAITISWNANHAILWMIERGVRRSAIQTVK